jgi:hypothetical protein
MDEVERGMVKEEELGQVWWVQVAQELTKMATKEAVQQENPMLILIMAMLLSKSNCSDGQFLFKYKPVYHRVWLTSAWAYTDLINSLTA